jgi:hypothetical protein
MMQTAHSLDLTVTQISAEASAGLTQGKGQADLLDAMAVAESSVTNRGLSRRK